MLFTIEMSTPVIMRVSCYTASHHQGTKCAPFYFLSFFKNKSIVSWKWYAFSKSKQMKNHLQCVSPQCYLLRTLSRLFLRGVCMYSLAKSNVISCYFLRLINFLLSEEVSSFCKNSSFAHCTIGTVMTCLFP